MSEPVTTEAVSSIEFLDHSIVATAGLDAGEFPLEGTFETILFELVAEDLEEGESMFAVRADGEYVNDAVAVTIEDEFAELKLLFLGLPLEAFPADIQANLVSAMIGWFSE